MPVSLRSRLSSTSLKKIFWALTWIKTNNVKINKVGSSGLETKMKSYCLPYLVNRSRIFHNCVSWYNWAVDDNLSRHEFQHVHFFSRERRLASGILSPSSSVPRNGETFVFFSHHAPDFRKGAKFLSSESLYTNFCSQFSNVFTVSIFVKHRCLGARGVLPL